MAPHALTINASKIGANENMMPNDRGRRRKKSALEALLMAIV